MQVSMATLRVATTRYHHTDRVSRDTYHASHIYPVVTVTSKREEGDGAKASNRQKWQLKAKCTFSHSWQAKYVSLAKPHLSATEHDCPERPLASIGLSQTLPKLHLATYNKTKIIVYIRVSQS